MSIKKRLVQVDTLIQDVLSATKYDLASKKVEITVDCYLEDCSRTITCDDSRIEQVLINLIKNSIDFVPSEGGKITIRIEGFITDDTNLEMVKFSVKDNGIGISSEQGKLIFQKFAKCSHPGIVRKYGGSGIGLAICHGIVEAHGGKIWLDCEHSDTGALFRFTLPL